MFHMIRPALVVVMAIGLMAGCSALKIGDRMQDFEDTSRAYGRAIAWSEYDVAAAFLKAGDQNQTTSDIDYLNQFKVTDYEPRLGSVLEKDVRIRQVVKISYFRKDDLIVRTISDDQLWEYDADKSSWVLTTGFPKFK
jgi:hypothetical protein